MTKKRRGRKPLPEGERKGRLVQTRVPETLDEALKEEARKHRVSVSQLIRNVLEDTFSLVEHAVAEATSLGQTVKRDAQRIAESVKGKPKQSASAATDPPSLEGVYGWQEIVLSAERRCSRCHKLLSKHAKGYLGLQDNPSARRVVICSSCASGRV